MRVEEVSNVSVVDIWVIKPAFADVQQEGSNVGSAREQAILRLCARLKRSKTVAKELEVCVNQTPDEGVVQLTM